MDCLGHKRLQRASGTEHRCVLDIKFILVAHLVMFMMLASFVCAIIASICQRLAFNYFGSSGQRLRDAVTMTFQLRVYNDLSATFCNLFSVWSLRFTVSTVWANDQLQFPIGLPLVVHVSVPDQFLGLFVEVQTADLYSTY